MRIEIKEKDMRLTQPGTVANLLYGVLSAEDEMDQDKEHFWVIGLTQANKIKYLELSSLGTLNASLVHPREIFRLAISQAVAGIIVAHNHPSGNLKPSDDDIRLIQQLAGAGKIIGIRVFDSVIIGVSGSGFYSFNDSGLM